MKKIITSIISIVMILSVLSVNIYADETDITKNSDGSITQKIYDDAVKDKITLDGKSYTVDKKVDKTESVREIKTLTETKIFDNLEEKKVPQTLDVDIEGETFTLKLSDVQYQEKEIENGTIDLTGSIDYGFLTERPSIAPTKQVTYKDNGIDKTATIPYSYLDKSNEYWKSGFSVMGRYIGDDDTMYFSFNGTLIPNTSDGSVPYVNYENTILESLGINPSIAKIDSANWTNTFTEQGQQVKECIFNLSYYGADYKANYNGNVTGHKTVYEATATYTLENANVKTGDEITFYEVIYKPHSLLDDLLNNPIAVTTSIVLALAMLSVLIMLIIKRIGKKEGDENRKYKSTRINTVSQSMDKS